jgi:hypothetical protein
VRPALRSAPSHCLRLATSAHDAGDVLRLPGKNRFRVDYLNACKFLRVQPHPALLPETVAAPADTFLLPTSPIHPTRAADAALHTGHLRRAFVFGEPGDPALDTITLREPTHGPAADGSLPAPARIGWADALCLGAALVSARHVRRLVLFRAGLDAAALVELARVLPATALRELHIEGNPIEASFFSSAAHAAGAAAAAGGGAADAAMGAHEASGDVVTAEDLLQPPTDAHPVSVPLSFPTAAHLWSSFALLLSPLEVLSLRGNDLDGSVAAKLGEAVSLNTNLRELDLGNNPIGDAGVADLLVGVMQNRTLRA